MRDSHVPVDDGVRLHIREADGAGRPFLLVHGLASNARTWDGVAHHLAEAGHRVVAVDLRGHGESDAPGTGYDTLTAAADVAVIAKELGHPVIAGQSWGGNVVLQLAADHPDLPHAITMVDGGWIHLADSFPSWEDCAKRLAPPNFAGMQAAALEARFRRAHPDWPETGIAGTLGNFRIDPDGSSRPRLTRERHMSILRSLWEHRPRALYPLVTAPVLLVPAGRATPAVEEAAGALRHATVHAYGDADHDVHAQHPDQIAHDLLELA